MPRITNPRGGYIGSVPALVLSHGTLRYAAFADRLDAAAAAGFESIGLTVQEYRALREQGWSDRELVSELRSYGLAMAEIELIVGFSGPAGPAQVPERPGLTYADRTVEADAFHMADVFGVRNLQAVGRFDNQPPGPDAVPEFAALCDRAAVHGLRIALEFVPYTSIPDITSATAIVVEADRPNGGLCVDSWHFFRGAANFEELRKAPADKVFMIQLNDGAAVPRNPLRMVDAVHNRLCPGEGVFDLDAFLTTLWEIGANIDISVEIFSDTLQRQTARTAAGIAADSTRKMLDRLTGGPRIMGRVG